MNNIAVKRSRVRGKRGNETRGDGGESLLERWKAARWAKVGNEFTDSCEFQAFSADAGGVREPGLRGDFCCAADAGAAEAGAAERVELAEAAGADEFDKSSKAGGAGAGRAATCCGSKCDCAGAPFENTFGAGARIHGVEQRGPDYSGNCGGVAETGAGRGGIHSVCHRGTIFSLADPATGEEARDTAECGDFAGEADRPDRIGHRVDGGAFDRGAIVHAERFDQNAGNWRSGDWVRVPEYFAEFSGGDFAAAE